MSDQPTKHCPMCGETKPVDQFYSDQSRSTGIAGRCKECDKKKRMDYYHSTGYKGGAYRKRCLVSGVDQRRQIRAETLSAYGNRCVCCGESTPEFLSIDHVYNDGTKHRKSIKRNAGWVFYKWLKDNGYPQDRYQILCFNCNLAKAFFGGCPHARKEEKAA